MKFSILFIFISVLTFGQNKFVGEYKRLLHLSDTLENPPPVYEINKFFQVNVDNTYSYTEEEGLMFSDHQKETISGSWKSNGDTITFYNKNYVTPKGYKYNYYPNQTFNGIKLIIKDTKLKSIPFERCSVDSFDVVSKTYYAAKLYKSLPKDTLTIMDTLYTSISFSPKDFCKEFRDCMNFKLGLFGVKNGTLIELIVFSREIEIIFNAKQYILTKNILHEVSTKCYMPDAWTDNFIRTK